MRHPRSPSPIYDLRALTRRGFLSLQITSQVFLELDGAPVAARDVLRSGDSNPRPTGVRDEHHAADRALRQLADLGARLSRYVRILVLEPGRARIPANSRHRRIEVPRDLAARGRA